MKKFWLTALSVMLAAVMAFGLIACNDDPPETGGNEAVAAIAGDYAVYNAGMGNTYYLRISAEGTFKFSSKADFSDDKSAGTVGKPTSEYLMMYTSINGADVAVGKTTHFTLENDGRLNFSDPIYCGIAMIAVDEDEGLYGVPVEDYTPPVQVEVEQDTYVAQATFALADGTLESELYLTIAESSFRLFAMDVDEGFTFEKTGTYNKMGTTLTLAVGTEDYGTVKGNSETEVVLSVEETAFAEEELTMTKADLSSPMFLFETQKEAGMVMGQMRYYDLTLSVYANGTYEFTSGIMMGSYMEAKETGSYSFDFAKTTENVILTPDGGESVNATLDVATGKFSGKFVLLKMGATAEREDVELMLTISPVVGRYSFTWTMSMGQMSMTLTPHIEILADGTFTISSSESFSGDKGTGTVSANFAGYTMTYTEPADKSTTFVAENGDLRFTADIPYGSSTITSNETDGYIIAENLAFDGETYVATVEKDSVSTDLYLTFIGDNFLLFSNGFENNIFFCARGTAAVENGVYTLTDTEGNVLGTVTPDENGMNASLKVFGETEARTFTMTMPASVYCMEFTAKVEHELMNKKYNFTVKLQLYVNGWYDFVSTGDLGAMGEQSLPESGIFEADIEAGKIVFSPVGEDGVFEESHEGAAAENIVASFFLSGMDKTRTEITLEMAGNDASGDMGGM